MHFLEAKAGADDAEEANEYKPPSKRKKATGAAAAVTARPAKASKTEAGGEDYVLELGGALRRASVKVYKGKVQVDLREFYEASPRCMAPLHSPAWEVACAHMGARLCAHLRSKVTASASHPSRTRRVRRSSPAPRASP